MKMWKKCMAISLSTNEIVEKCRTTFYTKVYAHKRKLRIKDWNFAVECTKWTYMFNQSMRETNGFFFWLQKNLNKISILWWIELWADMNDSFEFLSILINMKISDSFYRSYNKLPEHFSIFQFFVVMLENEILQLIKAFEFMMRIWFVFMDHCIGYGSTHEAINRSRDWESDREDKCNEFHVKQQ